MKFRDSLYNGMYEYFVSRPFFKNPKKSTWGVCCFATVLYLFGFYAIAVDALNRHDIAVPIKFATAHFVIAALVFIGSDLGGSDYWFGSKPKNLNPKEKTSARLIAMIFVIGAAVFFFGTNYLLYV